MTWEQILKEAWNLLRGALGAALTVCIITFFQYLGAHIPDLMQAVSIVGGGYGGVKATFKV